MMDTKAARMLQQLGRQIEEVLRELPDDRSEVVLARRSLQRMLGMMLERGGRPSYVAVLAPNTEPHSLKLRQVLAEAGLTFAEPVSAHDGSPVYLLQAEEKLLAILYPTIKFPQLPAAVKVVVGDIEEIVAGAANVLRFLDEEGVVSLPDEVKRRAPEDLPYAREKLRRSSTACALRTVTDVPYKKICCGGKVRELRAVVCPFHTLLETKSCLRCEHRLIPGAPASEEMLGLIEMRKAELPAKIQEEIAAGRALP